MQIDLGKNPFKKFTKMALVEMLEDAIMAEKDRSLPMHKRGQKDKVEKDQATEEADEEREDLADLVEEKRGKPTPVEMDEEDLSDEAMDKIESKVKSVAAPKAKKKNV
jgi:hypothetical protein